MFRKEFFLAALMAALAFSMAACGEDSESGPLPPDGIGGNGGEPGDGEPGDGEPGDGEPGDGEPGDGEPGDGEPGDGEPGEDADCERLCDSARDSCEWLDGEAEDYEEARAVCVAACEEAPDCVGPAVEACDIQAFEACFLSEDESAACAAMCDHLYYDCGMNLGVSRAQCGIGCSAGDFSEAQIACFTNSSCDEDEANACWDADNDPGEQGPDACEEACSHVLDECGLETWNPTSCTRACKAAYTEEQKECLSTLVCTEDPIEACFGEFSCTNMCNHVYNTCESAISDGSQEDCEVFCMFGFFSDTEMTCFSSAACEDLEACDETSDEGDTE